MVTKYGWEGQIRERGRGERGREGGEEPGVLDRVDSDMTLVYEGLYLDCYSLERSVKSTAFTTHRYKFSFVIFHFCMEGHLKLRSQSF